MKVRMYKVKDVVAGMFLPTMESRSDAEAKRDFANAVKQVPHGADLQLYFMGSFDDVSGTYELVDPERIATGHEFMVEFEEEGSPQKLEVV